jgi:hypothetical protein
LVTPDEAAAAMAYQARIERRRQERKAAVPRQIDVPTSDDPNSTEDVMKTEISAENPEIELPTIAQPKRPGLSDLKAAAMARRQKETVSEPA